jgi:hypothetical protein
MKATGKGCVYRPTKTEVRNGKRRKGKTHFYWARYEDSNGKSMQHALKLPNGQKVTDKDVARSELNRILKRVEREAAGLTDPCLEAANTSIRTVLANFIRHLTVQRKVTLQA